MEAWINFTGNNPADWERRALLRMDVVWRNLRHAEANEADIEVAERPMSDALFDALF